MFLGKGIRQYATNLREAPMPKCNFNKVACNFIEIALQCGRSPVNFLHIFTTPIYNNISGGLLLNSKRFEKTFISLRSI